MQRCNCWAAGAIRLLAKVDSSNRDKTEWHGGAIWAPCLPTDVGGDQRYCVISAALRFVQLGELGAGGHGAYRVLFKEQSEGDKDQ
jgi:hypothetical protein